MVHDGGNAETRGVGGGEPRRDGGDVALTDSDTQIFRVGVCDGKREETEESEYHGEDDGKHGSLLRVSGRAVMPTRSLRAHAHEHTDHKAAAATASRKGVRIRRAVERVSRTNRRPYCPPPPRGRARSSRPARRARIPRARVGACRRPRRVRSLSAQAVSIVVAPDTRPPDAFGTVAEMAYDPAMARNVRTSRRIEVRAPLQGTVIALEVREGEWCHQGKRFSCSNR